MSLAGPRTGKVDGGGELPEARANLSTEEALRRAERLQRVAGALAEALTPQQVLDAVLGEGVRAAEARAGLIALTTEDGAFLEVVASRGYRNDMMERYQTFPIAHEFPLGRAVLTGEPIFIRSRKERDELFPSFSAADNDSHAIVLLPLTANGRTIGGLTFSFDRDEDFDEGRRALKVALAQQAALAIERARLYETEKELRVAEEAARKRIAFLADASVLLSSSLDYESTLKRLAELVVPQLADVCAIDMVDDEGGIERLAVVHAGPELAPLADRLRRRRLPDRGRTSGVAHVVRTQEPEFFPHVTDQLLIDATKEDDELLGILRQLALKSWICVPLVLRGRTLGALTMVAASSRRRYAEADLELALEVAMRATLAVDNALLYREAERRSEAAHALAYVGDGVIVVDRAGFVRHWNHAAELITGVVERDAHGVRIDNVLPGWQAIAEQLDSVPFDSGCLSRPVTVPLVIGADERWLSVSAVEFPGGTVYALRDVTDERTLERTRSEFVATASHELRTPLAAVYGAARTLLREDIKFSPEQSREFLRIIESETERLAGIVAQILDTGKLESGAIQIHKEVVCPSEIAASVIDSARLRTPPNLRLTLERDRDGQAVVADGTKLRQVLANLVDNAIKYSPDGGEITITITSGDGHGRLIVRDQGLGIPAAEHARIFEKFYRLDPALTRGIGGSGLGLYISRELVQRMGGRLTVKSRPGQGSSFMIELPLVAGQADERLALGVSADPVNT